jgi:NAD+ diphosphatase
MDPIPFSGSPLDREGVRRRDRAWLDAQLADPSSRFLPVWQAKPLLKREPRSLAWAKREFFADVEAPEPVFLGSGDGVAHFAVDVSAVEKPEVAFGIADVASFDDLRAAVAMLPAADAAIAAQARSMVDWHARHRHCAACGGHTRSVLGGANRVCFDCQASTSRAPIRSRSRSWCAATSACSAAVRAGPRTCSPRSRASSKPARASRTRCAAR